MNNSALENIRIVLIRTTHAGNIGASARAMKNMGLSKLCLVNPSHFPHVDATARASGADDILANAIVTDSLDEALADTQLVIGTSARLRNLSIPLLNTQDCAKKLIIEARNTNTAILFGTENSGLTNDELLKCHYHIHIPTNPDFYSLNLASAVQIIVYELRMTYLNHTTAESKTENNKYPLAKVSEVEGFYEHLNNVLELLDFLKFPHSHQVMQRLRRLFNRAKLEERELNILRGILTTIEKRTSS